MEVLLRRRSSEAWRASATGDTSFERPREYMVVHEIIISLYPLPRKSVSVGADKGADTSLLYLLISDSFGLDYKQSMSITSRFYYRVDLIPCGVVPRRVLYPMAHANGIKNYLVYPLHRPQVVLRPRYPR